MPIVPLIVMESASRAVFSPPFSNQEPNFSLNPLGVAGFFGGDSAVNGMATVNLLPNRRWVGWYNTPGSYEIAKRFGPLARWRLCDGFFPGGEHNPAKLFGIDSKVGPQFIAVHSGSSFSHTGHLAHLITRKTESLQSTDLRLPPAERRTTPVTVSIVNLRNVPGEIVLPRLPSSWWYSTLFALAPIAVSVGASVGCALVADWFSFASITLGIVANGASCFVIGSGNLIFKHHTPAPHAPPGDGVLKGETELVVLVGKEGAVNTFTRGHFLLQYRGQRQNNGQACVACGGDNTRCNVCGRAPPGYEAQSRRLIPPQSYIGPCALLLMAQFLAQLLLIPQGKLFGQLMFVITILVSWMYNSYLCSLDREEIQTEILFKDVLKLDPDRDIQKYELDTWTAGVTFTCLVLAGVNPLKAPRQLLDAILPNDTPVWRAWKETMARKLKSSNLLTRKAGFKFSEEEREGDGLDRADRGLLGTVLGDADRAWLLWEEASREPNMRRLRGEVV